MKLKLSQFIGYSSPSKPHSFEKLKKTLQELINFSMRSSFPSWNHVSKTNEIPPILPCALNEEIQRYPEVGWSVRWSFRVAEEGSHKCSNICFRTGGNILGSHWCISACCGKYFDTVDDEKRGRVISYFSKKLCIAEKDCLLFLEVKHSIAEKDYSGSYTSWIDSGVTCKEKPLKYLPSIKCWNTSSPIVS